MYFIFGWLGFVASNKNKINQNKDDLKRKRDQPAGGDPVLTAGKRKKIRERELAVIRNVMIQEATRKAAEGKIGSRPPPGKPMVLAPIGVIPGASIITREGLRHEKCKRVGPSIFLT